MEKNKEMKDKAELDCKMVDQVSGGMSPDEMWDMIHVGNCPYCYPHFEGTIYKLAGKYNCLSYGRQFT